MLTKITYRLLLFLALVIAISNKGVAQQENVGMRQRNQDSIHLLVGQCNSDTCRFHILQNYFWQHASYDINLVRQAGEQAYREIKHSSNLERRSDGYDIKGFLYESEKKYDSAALFFHKALALARKTGYISRIRWSYYHLGLIYGATGNADSAFYYYKTLHRQYPSDISSSPSDYDVYRQMAYLFNDTYEMPDSAEKYFLQTLLLSREASNAQREIESHMNLMNFYYKTNQIKKLLETINTALVLAEKHNHEKALINIYNMIGDMFLENKKNYELALGYYKKVLEICKPKYSHWEATILNDIGNVYLKMGDDKLALQYVNAGFKVAQKMNLKHQKSESYRNLGNIYKSQGRFQDAIRYFKACYSTGCDQCSKIAFHQALVDIADSYMELGNRDLALEYYNKSLQLAHEYDAPLEQAISGLKLGNYYGKTNPGVANPFYESAMQCAQRSHHLQTIRDVADTLSSWYEKKADYMLAFRYQKLSNAMDDSIAIIENQAHLADWQLKFEVDKISKENKLHEQIAAAEIKRQKIFRNASLFISFLFIILGTVVYLGYNRKKKDNVLLEKMAADLHRADELKLRFFANVSHELRTPLTLIKAPLDILLSHTDDPKQKEYLNIIRKNSHKLIQMINQLLNLRKIDEGSVRLQLMNGDISAYIREIVTLFEYVAKNNEIHLHFQSTVNFKIPFDPEKVETIISNLLTNAIKHTPKGGMISVNIADEKELDDTIAITVQDTGIGIKKTDLEQIFNRFYSVSEAFNDNSGVGSSGIGLSLVKELVAIHQGQISVESIAGAGTRFIIKIPAYIDAYNHAVVLELPPGQMNAKLYRDEPISEDRFLVNFALKGDYKILIVEDNNDLRKFLKSEVSHYAKVITASNGEEGSKMAESELPDIIITDVMMPVMNGIELCIHLKSNINTSHIPIIMLSAKASIDSQIEGMNTGADDYIPKPFNLSLLLTKIHSVLKTREVLRQHYHNQLSIIPAEITVTNADENIIRKLIEVIEEKISEPDLSANLLASVVGMSRSVLYAKLKGITGQSVNEFIRTVKLKKASRVLMQNNKTVSEVAYMFGFNTPQYFTKCFKEEFGTTPKEFSSKQLT